MTLTSPDALETRDAAGRHRVVVVGHGMVAARFLDDLDRSVAPGTVEVTVLGEEQHRPYNRLLLAEVVAGDVDPASLTLPGTPSGVRVHTGRAAHRIDRLRGVVVDAAGEEYPFDTLVLATGAAARVPELSGLAPGDPLPPGVHTLRTLDDCRRLVRSCRGATRAAVLGGGLLGVEAARGLIARGIGVTVVHAGPHVLDRQLDALSADVARRAMGDLGLEVISGGQAKALVMDGVGRVRALVLGDGRVLEADVVLITAGVVPRVELARRAGLSTERGIIVGDDLRSPDDPRIAAIGDCAQPPEGCPGLLAPGWEQAGRLASELAARLNRTPDANGSSPDRSAPERPEVVRLKAADLDIVTLGHLPDDDEARVISLVDRQARRSLQVAIAEERIVGAVLVGAGPIAADLTVAYERGTPVPADPALLLVGGAAMLAPVENDEEATVCTCNQVSRAAIAEACRAGAHTIADIACATRATTGCGGCLGAVNALLSRHAVATAPDPPVGAVVGSQSFRR